MNFNELFTAGVHKKRQHKNGVEINSTSDKGGACGVDTHNKVRHLILPRNGMAYGKVVRAHELLHAEYTRLRGDETHPDHFIDNCAEDMMIQGYRFLRRFPHLLREWLSVAMYDAWTCSKIPIASLPPSPMRDHLYCGMLVELGRAQVVLKSMPTDSDALTKTASRLRLAIEKTSHEMADCIGMDRERFENYLWQAGSWADSVDTHSIRSDRKIYKRIAHYLEALLPKVDSSKRRGEGEPDKALPPQKPDKYKVTGSGSMAVFFPQLSRRCRVSRAGRRSRNAGTHIKASRLHRLKRGSITGLFREKARDVAGIVLIDASGSMGVDAENLDKLTAILPASTIAYYCSTSATPSGCQGHLVVHADGGMRCEGIPYDLVGGGNGVDLHALRWMLAKESKGKKYFITDECWASPDDEDEMTEELLDQHRSEITVLHSFESAWHYFDTEGEHRED